MSYVADTYKRFNLEFIKGKGCFLYDKNGEKYLDLVGGIAVCSLGHSHDYFTEKLKEQINDIIHVSNLYKIPPQEELAEKICNITFAEKVFFCNSGAEANEAAIKLVRKYGYSINKSKTKIISCINSFHGRTTGAISITGQEKYRKNFGNLLPHVDFVEFNNIDSLKDKFDETVCGIFIEIIQGEGGINLIDKDFLNEIKLLCNKFNVLLVVDEVQTGVGRTGKYFAYEHFEVIPDLITIAKGLGGGVPIGALAGKKEIMDVLSPGSHASTFGGNYLASRAGLTVLEVIERENILKNVVDVGNYFYKNLLELKDKYSFIKKVKGLGLIIGVELDFPAINIVNSLIEENVLTVAAGENVLRFVPPLILTKHEVDIAIEKLDKVFKNR
jgi:acetylornithine/N-succinyldiaminopimelate aminotransferase